jgi:hypothetical protein
VAWVLAHAGWRAQRASWVVHGTGRPEGRCQRYRTKRTTVQINSKGEKRLSGLQTCGRRWSCPWCGDVAAQDAARRTVRALKITQGAHGKGFLGTGLLSVSHTRPDPLFETFNLVRGSVVGAGGRDARLLAHLHGVRWSQISTEVVDGDNGWHPHCHSVFWAKNKSAAASYWADVWEAHSAHCFEHGRKTVYQANAMQEVREVENIASYLGGGNLMEFSSPSCKGSPRQLLLAAAKGCKKSFARWMEYREVVSGKRAVTWWSADCKSADLEAAAPFESPWRDFSGITDEGVDTAIKVGIVPTEQTFPLELSI